MDFVEFTGKETEREFLEKCLEQWDSTMVEEKDAQVSFMELGAMFSEMRHRVDELEEMEMSQIVSGKMIRSLRLEMGLTLEQFGKKLNPPASDSLVSRWERSVNAPNRERMKQIKKLKTDFNEK